MTIETQQRARWVEQGHEVDRARTLDSAVGNMSAGLRRRGWSYARFNYGMFSGR